MNRGGLGGGGGEVGGGGVGMVVVVVVCVVWRGKVEMAGRGGVSWVVPLVGYRLHILAMRGGAFGGSGSQVKQSPVEAPPPEAIHRSWIPRAHVLRMVVVFLPPHFTQVFAGVRRVW